MRLSVRLAAMVALLVCVAMALTWLRTDTVHAGNQLHVLFGQKVTLERDCSRVELSIARLKNQERLRQEAAALLKADESDHVRSVVLPHTAAAGSGTMMVISSGTHVLQAPVENLPRLEMFYPSPLRGEGGRRPGEGDERR